MKMKQKLPLDKQHSLMIILVNYLDLINLLHMHRTNLELPEDKQHNLMIILVHYLDNKNLQHMFKMNLKQLLKKQQ